MTKKYQSKILDFQFPRYFLKRDLYLPDHVLNESLNTTIEVSVDGEKDTLIDRHSTILYKNPSSITKFLYNILSTIIQRFVSDQQERDMINLGLIIKCKQYVYADYDTTPDDGPPVLANGNKMAVPAFIIHEIIEPLVGHIDVRPVLFEKCNFTDACRIAKNIDDLYAYNVSKTVGYHDFPLIVINSNLHNYPSITSHVLVKQMEATLGEDKTHKVIKNILLDPKSNVIKNLMLILRYLQGEPDFIVDFLEFMESHAKLSADEHDFSISIQEKFIQSDSYLKKFIKTSAEKMAPSVSKQWSQWSMLSGLIEKQLSPMRGSMWPTTESLGPYENQFRHFITDTAKKKNKTTLGMEELLDAYRSMYNHKAVEPSVLLETMLKDERVWK